MRAMIVDEAPAVLNSGFLDVSREAIGHSCKGCCRETHESRVEVLTPRYLHA